jgi:hypothetical protein
MSISTEFKYSFCVTNNNRYYDKIVFSINYFSMIPNEKFEIIPKNQEVTTLMPKCDKRHTRRNQLKRTKKTEFKYYFCTGNDFSNSKTPEYIIKYNEKIYEISIFTLFNEPQVSETGPSFPQQLKISYNNKQDIGELLDFCNKTHCENYLDDDLEDYNTLTMYICEENYWDNNGKKKKRDMDSIYIPEKLKIDLINEFEKFESKPYIDRLAELGITRKKVLMLEGPPGTGKSSLILAIASKLDKDIAYFSFTPDITDTKLIKGMQNTPGDSLIVLEDIDCLFEDRKPNDSVKNNITFSALLNCLDGIICKDGLVVIATTNHLNKLDPALIRSGRIDRVVSLTYMKKDEICKMFQKFIENDYSEGSDIEFYKLVKSLDIKITPSLLQQYLFKYIDQREEAIKNYEQIKVLYDKVTQSEKGLYM